MTETPEARNPMTQTDDELIRGLRAAAESVRTRQPLMRIPADHKHDADLLMEEAADRIDALSDACSAAEDDLKTCTDDKVAAEKALVEAGEENARLRVELGEIKLVLESQDLRLEEFKAAKDAAEQRERALRVALKTAEHFVEASYFNIRNSGGERRAKEYGLALEEIRQALTPSAPPAEKPHQTEARAGADDYAAALERGREDAKDMEEDMRRHKQNAKGFIARTTQEAVMQELTDEGQRINPEAYGGTPDRVADVVKAARKVAEQQHLTKTTGDNIARLEKALAALDGGTEL